MPEAVTDAVRRFYSVLPFNYEGSVAESARTVREHNQIVSAYPPLDAVLRTLRAQAVLDVGCGAGWFVNTVAHHYRLPAIGIDLCEPAIERARAVAVELGLGRLVQYRCLDLFEADGSGWQPLTRFALVNSLGVLHHTHDCRQAFLAVAGLVAPGGYLHVGLYHTYGRAPFLELFHTCRQAYQAASTEVERERIEAQALTRYQQLHPPLTDRTMLRSWCRDQVLHPHESQHTFQEVYGWLAACGLECVATSINQFQPLREWTVLFQQEAQLAALSYQRNVKEGRYFPGFFIVLAKRP